MDWCRKAEAADRAPVVTRGGDRGIALRSGTAAAQHLAPRAGSATLSATDSGGVAIWCPDGAGAKCYCRQGTWHRGCADSEAHCTDDLECGPGGKLCTCTLE